ncbi:zinc-dependent alcohol dehydrogenase family protein [soil metagenome]
MDRSNTQGMRAAMLHGRRDVRLENVEVPRLRGSRDAIVRVTASCVCGSDLHPYRNGLGDAPPKRAGHEFVGVVEEVGRGVQTTGVGDLVIAPFAISDGTCANCVNGITTSCDNGSFWGGTEPDGTPVGGAQADLVRVPWAEGTLVRVPVADDDLLPDLLTLSDVMATGWHAAVCAQVRPGSTAVVVGDGAVGLCGVLAARVQGAERIVAVSRHPRRRALAEAFGATDVVASRGPDGVAETLDLLGGRGADSVLECVGTAESIEQAAGSARPGGSVGFVGAPSGALPTGPMFSRNLRYAGGVAPVRAYLPALLDLVLAGTLRPGAVFDSVMPLDDVALAYAAMDDRESTKVMLVP